MTVTLTLPPAEPGTFLTFSRLPPEGLRIDDQWFDSPVEGLYVRSERDQRWRWESTGRPLNDPLGPWLEFNQGKKS